MGFIWGHYRREPELYLYSGLGRWLFYRSHWSTILRCLGRGPVRSDSQSRLSSVSPHMDNEGIWKNADYQHYNNLVYYPLIKFASTVFSVFAPLISLGAHS